MSKVLMIFVMGLCINTHCYASEQLKSNTTTRSPRQLMTGVIKTMNSVLAHRVVKVLSIPVIGVLVGYSLKEKETPYDSDPFNMRNETRPSRH